MNYQKLLIVKIKHEKCINMNYQNYLTKIQNPLLVHHGEIQYLGNNVTIVNL